MSLCTVCYQNQGFTALDGLCSDCRKKKNPGQKTSEETCDHCGASMTFVSIDNCDYWECPSCESNTFTFGEATKLLIFSIGFLGLGGVVMWLLSLL